MALQVIIPMAGIGSRFKDYGFTENKYLLPLDIDLTPMIELAITSLSIDIPCEYFFIINEENEYNKKLRHILGKICNKHNLNYYISSVDKLTEGPASTVNTIKNLINMDRPMLISNSDQVLDWKFHNFLQAASKYDGCVLTYKPNYNLTYGTPDKHSFIHIDEQTGKVDECREKIVLSDKALVGTHYIKKASTFFKCYDYMVRKNIRAPNGEFYISLVYQSMIENNYRVSYYNLSKDESYYPVGEPNDYFYYLYNKGNYTCNIKNINYNKILIDDSELKIEYIENYEPLIPENNNEQIIDLNTYQINNHFQNKRNVLKIQSEHIECENLNIYILRYKKTEKLNYYYHLYYKKIFFLLEGKMKINNIQFNKNDLFVLEKNQVFCPEFIEDCYILCICLSYYDDVYVYI